MSLQSSDYFDHMFLIHDYIHRFSRVPPFDSDHFNLQIQLSQGIQRVANRSGLLGTVLTAGGVVRYCYRGKHMFFKAFFPFLWWYWQSHIYVLSSYIGSMFWLPAALHQVEKYYNKHTALRNTHHQLVCFINSKQQYSVPENIIMDLFDKESIQESEHLNNAYFATEGSKYVKEEMKSRQEGQKLKYFDSFITRYAFYAFKHWIRRLVAFVKSDKLIS